MSISEQVKELKWYASYQECEKTQELMYNAADTIESLSAKLETANKELERWHTDKINDKIKNPFAWTSTLCCHNCDHKDEYIEELEAADMERSAEDCGGWIDGNKVVEQIENEIDGVIVKDTYSKGKNAGLRKAKIFIEEQMNHEP